MRSKKQSKAMRAANATAGTVSGVFGAIFKTLLTIFLIFITTGLLFTCVFAFYVKTCLSKDLDVSLSDFTLSQSSVILYQDKDEQWQELVTLASKEGKRVWVDYEQIPKNMEHALVAIEDQRFYKHKGVDWYRTVGAFATMFVAMRNDFGGSTITQQLIKNLTGNDEPTVQRKLLEIFQALEFEKKYSKQDIIEWYLNAVYFGEGCYGVYTAAKTYYNKELSELSLAECASIVAITNNPSKYDPFVSVKNNTDRQQTVLRVMYEQGYIGYDEYTSALAEKLVPVRSEGEEYSQEIYSYYEETVINDVLNDLMSRKGIGEEAATHLLYSGGYRIYSCYRPDVQAYVDGTYENLANLPQSYRSSNQQLQSAMVVMDPHTGAVLALSGGVGEKTANFVLNRINSQRPPGSSLKPLAVYGPALEYNLITPNTLVNDDPDIELAGTWWYPRNSGGGNRGIITVRQALISSINTVSAQILDKLGVSASYQYLTDKLGFTTLVEDDRNYAPLSLGELTHGATPREMCQAYCAFVNDGVFTKSRTYEYVKDRNGNMVLDNPPQTHVAWKANTAYSILSMLKDAATYGTGSESAFPGMSVAGKTGTSSDNWNRWFVGMTPYYVASVWTGYDTNAPMYFYGNPATQIWKKVMQPLHNGLPDKGFPTPAYGSDTQIFGDLTEELEEQEHPSPSPSPTPAQTPAATPIQSPPPTPAVTDTPAAAEPVY
ncbi:MAG: transglycosylase domain-containing protein [Oscillospiraceae bacterium]